MNDIETMSDFGQAELTAMDQSVILETNISELDRAYEISNDKTLSSTDNKSERPVACIAIVPAQQLYCKVQRVPAAPSTAQMGSVCSCQNLGDS
jgi:hypothetical protein